MEQARSSLSQLWGLWSDYSLLAFQQLGLKEKGTYAGKQHAEAWWQKPG